MTDPRPPAQDAVTYRPHFGLERNPFGLLGNCDELFDLQAGAEAAARLGHLLELSGIGVLTGQPGCGKTTVCRRFLDSLHPLRHRICQVALTTGTAFDTYRLIAWELGVEPVHTRAGCYRLIRNEILDQRQSRRQLVLIIDEAQNLRNDVLEELRLLINFDIEGKCPVCLLLVGLTDLDQRLALARHRALDQRIVMRHRFPGIAREEVEDYLEHRLRLAGCPRKLFAPEAAQALFDASKGLLRPLDNLAHYALAAAAVEQARTVSARHVERAVPETRSRTPVQYRDR